jgi:hypothetical protein
MRAAGWISAVGLVLNAIGFLLIWKQLGLQVAAQRGEVSNSLTALSYDVLNLMESKPQLYEYFYEGKSLTEGDPNRVSVLLCAEMIANYCDNAIQQAGSMSDDVWESWRRYIVQQYQISPAFREFVRMRRDWYSPDLVQVFEHAEQSMTAPRKDR